MTPEQAAWVRQHAWHPYLRRQHALAGDRPGPQRCACQGAPSPECRDGEHGRCRASMWPRGRVPETTLDIWAPSSRGLAVGHTVLLDTAADTGPGSRPHLVRVWLTGRTCRTGCSCSCHPRPRAWDDGLLFGLEAVAR